MGQENEVLGPQLPTPSPAWAYQQSRMLGGGEGQKSPSSPRHSPVFPEYRPSLSRLSTWKLSQWVHSVWLSVSQVHHQFSAGWAAGVRARCAPAPASGNLQGWGTQAQVGCLLASPPPSLPCVPGGDQSRSFKDKALGASLHPAPSLPNHRPATIHMHVTQSLGAAAVMPAASRVHRAWTGLHRRATLP